MKKMIFFLIVCSQAFSLNILVLAGPPGSGKGTFGQFALEKEIGHISAGDLIRLEIEKETTLGLLMKETVLKGDFVDPEMIVTLIENEISLLLKKYNSLIIDGYGRTDQDRLNLECLLKKLGATVYVVFLNAENDSCKIRMEQRLICSHCSKIYSQQDSFTLNQSCLHCSEGFLRRRSNDTKEVIAKRIAQYRSDIELPFRKWASQFKTIEFNTDKSVEECFCLYENFIYKFLIPQDD